MLWIHIGCGRHFKGVYHLIKNTIILQNTKTIEGLNNPELDKEIGEDFAAEFRSEIELVKGASHSFDQKLFLSGKQTPVFFGSAINNFGVNELLEAFCEYAPEPLKREAIQRDVAPTEEKFTGFVFKIQANMDPQHRDRIAFLRVCSGQYSKAMKMHHVRLKRDIKISNALTFMAGQRDSVEEAYPGDIIGLHNHGAIQIGDTFTQGENLKFTGIPYFAPELFQSVRSKDPLKAKALQKGLVELSEEGATQVFRPINDNRIILGAVGVLQFDVVAERLKTEYRVDCVYEPINVATARWIECDNDKKLSEFKDKLTANLAIDGGGNLTYIAPSMVNLNLTMERWPDIEFRETREH